MGNEENGLNSVFMRSPEGEVKEVEATTAALTPLMVSGWIQVLPPAAGQKPATPAKEEE